MFESSRVLPMKGRSIGLHGDKLEVRVASPPDGGRANHEATVILEDLIGEEVALMRGMTDPHKVFQVANSKAETVLEKLGLSPESW